MSFRAFRPALTLVLIGLITGCSSSGPGSHSGAVTRIACTDTPDCAARGGFCMDGECYADNECAADADCAAGETCVADDDFGGLCAAPDAPAVPGPAWACTLGKDCPAGQGCGEDSLCHEDGECTSSDDCAGGICYNAGNDDPAGFCGSDRPAHDPYCRSDGLGACRLECNSDGTCGGWGATCVDGFCHSEDECTVDADCSPNHICLPATEYEDYGYSLCAPDPSPTCVDDGAGACRLACETDLDCLDGGGCSTDGLCHASNECVSDTDCDTDLLCYPDEEFGGLCGPPRPM